MTDGATILDETDYVYNSSFNLTDVTYFDDSDEHWTYDGLSRVLTYTDPQGRVTEYTYDNPTGGEGCIGSAER